LTPNNKSLQFVAAQDIGIFAALAFANPQEYSGKAIGLAGSDLTYPQIEQAFKKYGTGPTFGFFGKGFLWAVKEMGIMMKWFGTDGYGADIPMLKQKNPELLDLATWLDTKSGWAKK